MGKKKKASKKHRKVAQNAAPPAGCKTKCCKKYKKGEHKRCKRCPCFDLLKHVA